jgi:hypothetical protein
MPDKVKSVRLFTLYGMRGKISLSAVIPWYTLSTNLGRAVGHVWNDQ